jgi:hypothetical protein
MSDLCNTISALPKYSRKELTLMQESDNTIKLFLAYFDSGQKPTAAVI